MPSFPKEERLCGKLATDRLLKGGKWGSCGHLKYCVLVRDAQSVPACSRLMVSVPKKLFRRAVKRNLLKRRLREAYRLQKAVLDGREEFFDILLAYNSAEVAASDILHDEVGQILSRL